jgi:hypothetical protein
MLLAHRETTRRFQDHRLEYTQDVHEHNYAVRRNYPSPGCTGSTSTLSCAVVPLDFSSVGRTGSHHASGHSVSRRDYSSSILHRLYRAYAVHLDAPSRHLTSHQSVALALAVCPVIPLCVVTTHLATATDIHQLRRATGSLGTLRGSSSTTSTTSRIWVPRHVARLVTRLVTPLLVDYFASRRLVVDYFTYTVHPGASARRAARRAARRRLLCLTQARRRLLRLRLASGCLGWTRRSLSTTSTTPRVWVPRHVARLVTWLVAPLVVDYFSSRRLVVDYFAYAARPGASARHTARRVARRRLLRVRRASECLGMSRGSSSTTSTTPRIWVPVDG